MKSQTLWCFLLVLCSCSSFAQKSPEELGQFVFDVFKERNVKALDTLTPNLTEIVAYYREIDSTFALPKQPDFPKKYGFHDTQFKQKCTAIMKGEAGVDFKKATFLELKYYVKEMGVSQDGKVLNRDYLEIYFMSDNKKYSLLFRSLHKIKNIWKLGENVRIRPAEEE